MNKEQVKKALECCTSRENKCSKCPYQRPFGCMKMGMIQDALQLINEQEEKIKQQDDEIELLEKAISDQNEQCWNCNKSVKEFAEELKETLIVNNEENTEIFDYQYTLETIDDLLKEYEK